MTDWHQVAVDQLAELDDVIRLVDQLDRFGVKEADSADEDDITVCVDVVDLDILLGDLARDLRHRLWLAELDDSRSAATVHR